MVQVDDFNIEKECVYKDEQYLVRDNGAVLRFPQDGKTVRPMDNKWTFGTKSRKTGYMTIGSHRVHIIVATAFHGANDTKKLVVDHIDTNRCNNRPENLRWVTRLENILLNEVTRTKIEFFCGSVENFLKNPELLKGHEQKDPNFSWMRTVTKEEAENTLRNWKTLVEGSQKKQSKGQLGEWLYQTSSPQPQTQTTASDLLPIKSREQLKQDMAKRRKMIEKKRQEKERAKKEAAKLRREQAKERRKEAWKMKSIIDDSVVSPMLNDEKYIDIKTVKVRFIPIECYCCGQEHYVYHVIGLFNESMPSLSTYEGIHNAFIEVDNFDPILVSGVKQYLANHPELHYIMGEIKERFSKTMNQSYMSFGCPECDALVGDHYLQEAFWDMEYEPDDEFVHIIELPKPGLKVKIEQYNHF